MIERPALRYHGAKFRLASWLLQFFPTHECYTEAYGGAAGVLLQKRRSRAEVYNDLDDDVVNFFHVLRDPRLCALLVQSCILTPYSRAEFEEAWERSHDPVERARRLAIRSQMGFGSAGATKGTTGFRYDTKREYGTAQQEWAIYPSAIAAAGMRLVGVLIENQAALRVLTDHDGPETLHFVDPPYQQSLRIMSSGKERCYRYEMTDSQHRELLEHLRGLQGMVVLTTYPSDLYERVLKDWSCFATKARASAGRGGTSRIEVAYLNPRCTSRQRQSGLFA